MRGGTHSTSVPVAQLSGERVKETETSSKAIFGPRNGFFHVQISNENGFKLCNGYSYTKTSYSNTHLCLQPGTQVTHIYSEIIYRLYTKQIQ